MKPAITVELHARPATISAANRDSFTIGFTVKNIGHQVIDPQLNLSELKVNGTPSQDWGMALMNSGHPASWKALSPGETVDGAWALARELFPHPGHYKLVLTVAGVASPVVEVDVTR